MTKFQHRTKFSNKKEDVPFRTILTIAALLSSHLSWEYLLQLQDRDVIYNCSSNRLYFPYYNSLSNMVTSFITALLLPGVNRQCRRWPSTSPWFFRSDRDSSGDAQTFRPEQFRWRHSQASLSLEPFHRRHRVSRRWLESLGRPTHSRSVCGRKRFSPEIVWLSESML